MNDHTPMTGRAVAQLSAGAPIVGIVPTTIEDTFRLAQLISQSGLAPYQLKNAQAVAVVLLKGLETGLPPMAALECIGVINGKAALHSDGIPALLWSRGFKLKEWYEGAGDGLTAKCTITRPDGTEVTGEFSVQDAKDARLWDAREKVQKKARDGSTYTGDNDAPWFRYRKRMLKMRARGWTARDAAADVLKGIPIFEEQRDIEDARRDEPRNITPVRNALEIPDIPDVPDLPVDVVPDDTAPDAAGDDQLQDAEGFLASLSEQRGWCECESDVDELRASMADLIERLSPADQARAEAILAGDGDEA